MFCFGQITNTYFITYSLENSAKGTVWISTKNKAFENKANSTRIVYL